MKLARKMHFSSSNAVYIGDRPALEMDLSIITYDSDSAEIKHLSSIDEVLQFKNSSKISWINIVGLKDINSIKLLGEKYSLHPLTIEDILDTEQEPKIEIFETYTYLSIKTIQQEKKAKKIESLKTKIKHENKINEFVIDQASIIIMKDVLITIQEVPNNSFDIVKKMILENIGEIRNSGIEYLTYSIIDAVVDEYFITLNHSEKDIEDFEDRATKTTDATFIEEIQDTKKELLKIKRAISPTKDNLLTIMSYIKLFQTEELKPFWQDLNENLSRAVIIVENHREWLSNIMDVNISVLSSQMNRVMKVLAIISTIFIPLTFIAGVYGMNFEFMPELGYKLAYPIVLGGMGLIGIIMVIVFKIRKWF